MTVPLRTHATDLSDDELLLFDFMFDCKTPAHYLMAKAYPDHLNTPYTHGLSDAELEAALDALVACGLVVRSTSCVGAGWVFGLSPEGGGMWERERRPDWSLYVRDSAEFTDQETECVSIVSPSQQTVRQFLTAASDCGLWTPLDEPREDWTTDTDLVPWKELGLLARVRFAAAAERPLTPDWKSYEARRTWWSSISELHRLRRGGA
jgi:hypothetical protein